MAVDPFDKIEALSVAEYSGAFQRVQPTKRQWEILRAHLAAPDHTSTARQLATALGYANGNPINLQYGTLAGKLCTELGVSPPRNISVLVTMEKPRAEWDLVLRPAVVEALRRLGEGTALGPASE